MEPEKSKVSAKDLLALERAKKAAGIFGIARKAGKLTAGTELVTAAIRAGSPGKCPVAVFLAKDLSANSEKRICNCCRYYGVPFHRSLLDCAELGAAVGKSGMVACVGITDAGLAEAAAKKNS